MILIDLTEWPKDWGTDEATQTNLKSPGWEFEPPSCYTCGHGSSSRGQSPLALKQISEEKMELFHFDCYYLFRLKEGQKKS